MQRCITSLMLQRTVERRCTHPIPLCSPDTPHTDLLTYGVKVWRKSEKVMLLLRRAKKQVVLSNSHAPFFSVTQWMRQQVNEKGSCASEMQAKSTPWLSQINAGMGNEMVRRRLPSAIRFPTVQRRFDSITFHYLHPSHLEMHRREPGVQRRDFNSSMFAFFFTSSLQLLDTSTLCIFFLCCPIYFCTLGCTSHQSKSTRCIASFYAIHPTLLSCAPSL